MEAYHGTSAESAKRIRKEGFRIDDSEEMFLGRGLYLAKSPLQAAEYGPVVLEVDLPESEICDDTNIAGIGTLEQFEEDMRHGMYLDEGQEASDVDTWELYKQIARERAEDAECPIIETETQFVVYDHDIARSLGKRARVYVSPYEKTRPQRRPNVRQYWRSM